MRFAATVTALAAQVSGRAAGRARRKPGRSPPLEGRGADRASAVPDVRQAEQEVVLQVELEVEVELVLVQPASTTSLASE